MCDYCQASVCVCICARVYVFFTYTYILAYMFIKTFLVTTCEKTTFNLFTFQLIHNGFFFTNFIYHIGV